MQTSPNERPLTAQPAHVAKPAPSANQANTTPPRPGKLLRLPRVQDLTGFGKSSIYAGVKAGTFPAPVRLSARAVGWKLSAVESWIQSRTTTVDGGHHA